MPIERTKGTATEYILDIVNWISEFEKLYKRNKVRFDALSKDHARLVNLVKEPKKGKKKCRLKN